MFGFQPMGFGGGFAPQGFGGMYGPPPMMNMQFAPQGPQGFGGGFGGFGGGFAPPPQFQPSFGGGMPPANDRTRSAPFQQGPQSAGPSDAEFMRNISGLSPAVQQQMLAERQRDQLPPGQRQFGPSAGPDVSNTFIDMGYVDSGKPDQYRPSRRGGGFGGGMGPMPQFGGGGQRQPMFGGGGFGGPQSMPQFGVGFQPPQFAMPQFGGLLGFGGGMPSNMGPQMPQQGGGQMGIGNFMQDQLRNAGMGPQRPQNKSMVEAASQQMQDMPPMMGDMRYRGGPMTPEQEAFGAQREQDMLRMMQMAGLNPGVSQAAYRRRDVNRE